MVMENPHCGECVHRTFLKCDNYCREWGKTIPREKWDDRKEDGTFVLKCGRFMYRYRDKL